MATKNLNSPKNATKDESILSKLGVYFSNFVNVKITLKQEQLDTNEQTVRKSFRSASIHNGTLQDDPSLYLHAGG